MSKHLLSDDVVPPSVKLAARRGFIRTAAQSLASVIPTGAIAISTTGQWWTGVALGIAGGIVTAVAAGAASFLSIISRGIPGEYAAAGEAPRA